MEKQKYLYKHTKCIGGTSSTVSLINAWISITGQRNIKKYRYLAYLGGFTIIAVATIWFLSQSQACKIEYNSKDKSDKSNKSNKSNKPKRKVEDTGKSDKRSNNTNKSSVSWWSSFREKIANKLGFGKKSKLSKSSKFGKPSSSRSNSSSKIGKHNIKKRSPKETESCGSVPSSKTSDVKLNGSTGSSDIRNHSHDSKPISICKKIQAIRRDNSRQKDHVTQKIQVESCGDKSSSSKNNLNQKNKITCGSNSTIKNNQVKQQERKLKLKAQEACSPIWTNRENKYRLGDCLTSKHSKRVNSVSPIINVKPNIDNKESVSPIINVKPNIDNKESNRPLTTDLETRISETIKNISFVDLQVKEKDKEFYIPYTPLTLRETFDQIGHERVERYKKLLMKLEKQKLEDSTFESTLKRIQGFFHEKKFYESEEDDDCQEKKVDHFDEFDDFLEKLDNLQNVTKTKVAVKDGADSNRCPNFADVLAQDEEASRKRIERNLEILKIIDSYQKQGKETESNIKKLIEMFNEQKAQCKGVTRHLKRPSRFYDEFSRFEDRLIDTEQQVKNLTEGLDDIEMYLTKTLELFNDDCKMNTAVAKYGPILIDDV